MENRSMFNDSFEGNQTDLRITPHIIGYLRETAKWAKFLAILGFIALGFLVIISFFAGSILAATYRGMGVGISSAFITIFYLIVAVIAFFPVYYMYKFAVDVNNAISSNNTELLTRGLGSLKSYFKFNGIMAIIVLSIYAFSMIIAIISFAVAGASAF